MLTWCLILVILRSPYHLFRRWTVITFTFQALVTHDTKTWFFLFLFFVVCTRLLLSFPSFVCYLDNDMQAGLVHQQRQRSNTHPNHYMNLSISYPVPLSTSNYHLLSDQTNNTNNNNSNTMAGDSGDMIDFHGSDTASHSSCSLTSSAASSSVHLPLASGVGTDSISARRRNSLLVGCIFGFYFPFRGSFSMKWDRRF